MAYTVDWVSKIFTIPQSDLTFVSGNNYSLSMVDVHEELRRLEWAFADGLWAPRILNFYETVTLSGIDKSPSIEVTNGYTFDFTGSNYNVILSDYDNNLVDVYIPSNGISILGNNSVGRQAVASTAIWTESLTEDYPVDGQSATTPTQMLYSINQMLSEFARTGVAVSVKKRDGTEAFQLTLDSATAPTSSTQSS